MGHVPSQHPPLGTSPATSISCVPPRMMAPKPKLSLNTTINNTQPRTFGKGSSLRLDTITNSSPTVRNTYSNAYERQTNPDSQSSGLKLVVSTPKDEAPSDSQSSAVSSATTTSSTLSLESDTCPYLHPLHLKSALRNGHYPRMPIRRMSSRPMFPLRKSVSFREPLQEDIRTTKYILSHADIDTLTPDTFSDSSSQSIETSDSTSISSDKCSPTTNGNMQISTNITQPVRSQVELQMPSASTSLPSERDMARQLLSHSSRTTSAISNTCPRKKGHKRDSSESGSDSDDSAPQTPIASKSKRHRWAWTLGPLPGYQTPDCDEIEVPMGSREGSVNGDDLPTLSPGALLSPAE